MIAITGARRWDDSRQTSLVPALREIRVCRDQGVDLLADRLLVVSSLIVRGQVGEVDELQCVAWIDELAGCRGGDVRLEHLLLQAVDGSLRGVEFLAALLPVGHLLLKVVHSVGLLTGGLELRFEVGVDFLLAEELVVPVDWRLLCALGIGVRILLLSI